MQYPLSPRARRCSLLMALAGMAACTDDAQPVAAVPETELAAAAASPAADLVTRDPQAFASAVRAAANDNEVLIWIKDADAPSLDESAFAGLPASQQLRIGLPANAGAGRRTALRHKLPGAAARSGVATLLARYGLQPYMEGSALPVVAVRVPDHALLPLVTALSRHANVDWIEPNRKHAAVPDAGPLGTNPTDTKHSLHNVQGAWDLTRGARTDGNEVKIGILDSGIAVYDECGGDRNDGLFCPAPDADVRVHYGSFGRYGVHTFGFSNNYPGGCTTSDRQQGNCEVADDQGHGTAMAGLPAELDNDLPASDYVGIAPHALTSSLKITHNSYVTGNTTCNGGTRSTYCIEDDDFVAAVDFASREGYEVLSMSFSSDFGTSVYNALSYAYYTYDVLPMSSTGNSSGQSREPQNYPFVMGVGGLNESGASLYNEEWEDISAYSGGGTLNRSCSGTSFCALNGYIFLSSSSGGTSASTANAAAIAGLVRAYNPTLTAAQVWTRLVSTSSGSTHQLDALKAVRGY